MVLRHELESKMYRVLLPLVLLLPNLALSSPPCGLYGQPPCQYLPAPAGCTPHCAKPGDTYCENVKTYPGHLIKRLIENYNVRSMIVDETSDELFLHTLKGHDETQHYQTFFGVPVTQPPFSADAPYTYGPPIHLGKNDFYGIGHQNSESRDIYSAPPQQQPHQQRNYYFKAHRQRYRRSRREAPKSSNGTRITLDTEGLPSVAAHNRTKRQIAFGREQLCQTRVQFVQPQAALNKQGNWMYVVNQGNEITQLVKTEVCASSVCSNLCQIPAGYNTRCEQKYIQKRLVALQSDGQRLYTDTFWFPACCVCTIASE